MSRRAMISSRTGTTSGGAYHLYTSMLRRQWPELSLSWRRDQLVAHAVGLKSWGGVNYYTAAQNVTGLMRAGSEGVNHGEAFSSV